MTTSEVSDDPFAIHLRREPLPDAGIRIILLTDLPSAKADGVIAPLVEFIAASGRAVECAVVPLAGSGFGQSLERGLERASLPLVLVTTALEPWTVEHLNPLLRAIDQCDHVVGRRPRGEPRRLDRPLASAPAAVDLRCSVARRPFACRLHRLDKLVAIPLQSASSFLDIEILAKATFLGHLIDEVDVPPLRGHIATAGWWADWNRVAARSAVRAAVRSSGRTAMPGRR